MQNVPTVGKFLEWGNVFRTAFNMTSRLQNRVNPLLRESKGPRILCHGIQQRFAQVIQNKIKIRWTTQIPNYTNI